MRGLIKTLATVFTLSLLLNTQVKAAGGRDLYVSVRGDDRSPGSRVRPWATLQYAADHVRPGDTVHVLPGVYGAVSTKISGAQQARTSFISEERWKAQVVGRGAMAAWENRADHIVIEGFDITGDGRFGVLNLASHTQIMGNRVHDIPAVPCERGESAAGIDNASYEASDNDIIGNEVFRVGPAHSRCALMHGIYQAHPGGRISNNVVCCTVGWGIHTWHAARDLVISNNTIVHNERGGILIGDGDAPGGQVHDNSIISNNIVAFNGDYGIMETGATGTHNLYLNNLLFSNAHAGVKLQNGNLALHTIKADPQFEGDSNGDYRLKRSSPGIRAGAEAGSPARDFEGVARPKSACDVGAFQMPASAVVNR